MKIVRFSYRGDAWVSYLIPKDEMTEFIDEGTDETAAFIDSSKSEIYFNDDVQYFKLSTILHELLHMARSYQYLDSMSVDFDNAEEFFCELFAEEGETLIELGKNILKAFNKLQKNNIDDDEIVLKEEK